LCKTITSRCASSLSSRALSRGSTAISSNGLRTTPMSMSFSTGELVNDGAIQRDLRMLPTAEEANAGDPSGRSKTCRFIRTTSLSCNTQSWAEPRTVLRVVALSHGLQDHPHRPRGRRLHTQRRRLGLRRPLRTLKYMVSADPALKARCASHDVPKAG